MKSLYTIIRNFKENSLTLNSESLYREEIAFYKSKKDPNVQKRITLLKENFQRLDYKRGKKSVNRM